MYKALIQQVFTGSTQEVILHKRQHKYQQIVQVGVVNIVNSCYKLYPKLRH